VAGTEILPAVRCCHLFCGHEYGRTSFGNFFVLLRGLRAAASDRPDDLALLPATSFCQSSSAPLVCCTMSWSSTTDQMSGFAGRTLPTRVSLQPNSSEQTMRAAVGVGSQSGQTARPK